MKELEMDTSLADMFNISSNKYKSDKIKDLPLTVRQCNALIAANCVTVEQLLNMTLRDLYAIKNLGKTSMYSADDGNTEVFYFRNVTATFSSFTHEPETVKF